MSLSSLIKICGSDKPMGVKLRIYGIPKGDITTFATASSTTNYGDAKVLDEPFVLASGKFWKEFDILVNSAEVLDEYVGETGGWSIQNVLPFHISGNGKEHRQFMDDLLAHDGCMVFLVPEKSGEVSVIGNLDNPAFIREGSGGSGGADNSKRGRSYRLYANTGYAAPIYQGPIVTS